MALLHNLSKNLHREFWESGALALFPEHAEGEEAVGGPAHGRNVSSSRGRAREVAARTTRRRP